MKNPIVDDIDALLKDLRLVYGLVIRPNGGGALLFCDGGHRVAIRTEGGVKCILSALLKEIETLETTRNKLTGVI